MKILFLDIDGPMLPLRAYAIRPAGSLRLHVFDPLAVALVNGLLTESGAKLVISSTWRLHGREKFEREMADNGLRPADLHDDWRTPQFDHREDEIQDWLARHPTDAFAVLDDEDVKIDNLVRVTFEDGIQWAHFTALCRLLGCDPHKALRANGGIVLLGSAA